MPELMMRYRAAAFFGRLYAPEIMMGMYSEFEQQDMQQNKATQIQELIKPIDESPQDDSSSPDQNP